MTLLFVPPSLRYLERLWGAAETLKFIAFTVTISNIIAFGLNWIEFIGTRNADMFLCVLVLLRNGSGLIVCVGITWSTTDRWLCKLESSSHLHNSFPSTMFKY